MKIDMIVAAWPPQLNGIGDYAYQLSHALAEQATIRVLTGEAANYETLDNVQVLPTFNVKHPQSVRVIAERVAANTPDWIVLQYNPFAYGHWGRNLHLPLVLREIKRKHSHIRLAVMVHEPFVPLNRWQFVVMSVWQRWQFRALGEAADVLLFSIDPWAQKFRGWFLNKPVLHLPVGSNIPYVPTTRQEARQRLQIGESTTVLGVFGTFGQASMIEWIRDTAAKIQQANRDMLVLYIGPRGSNICAALGDIPSNTDGPLPADEVSRRMAAMDIYLAPFSDGVSTRRSSLMTALQHGIPVVGTESFNTDALLRGENNRSLLLAPVSDISAFQEHALRLQRDLSLRAHIGIHGKQLYDQQFAWDRIASSLLAVLA